VGFDAGLSERLWDAESDLMDITDFDYEPASARLPGRDVARMVGPETRHRLIDILTGDLRPDGRGRLMAQWDDHGCAKAYSILASFAQGIEDIPA